MPHIRQAFKMKSQRVSNKEISEYLAKFWIKKRPDRLKNIFVNTIYIWYYTDPVTGEIYDKYIFTAGKPPISKSLFKKVQEILQSKGRWKTYKEPKERDFIAQISRTDEGLFLTKEIKTKTYKNGKTQQFIYYRSKKINIARKEILKALVEKFARMTQMILFLCSYNELLVYNRKLTELLKANKEEKKNFIIQKLKENESKPVKQKFCKQCAELLKIDEENKYNDFIKTHIKNNCDAIEFYKFAIWEFSQEEKTREAKNEINIFKNPIKPTYKEARDITLHQLKEVIQQIHPNETKAQEQRERTIKHIQAQIYEKESNFKTLKLDFIERALQVAK